MISLAPILIPFNLHAHLLVEGSGWPELENEDRLTTVARGGSVKSIRNRVSMNLEERRLEGGQLEHVLGSMPKAGKRTLSLFADRNLAAAAVALQYLSSSDPLSLLTRVSLSLWSLYTSRQLLTLPLVGLLRTLLSPLSL